MNLEYRDWAFMWAFMEAHPSRVILEAREKQEAYEAINWPMMGKLFLMHHNDSLTSFSYNVYFLLNHLFLLPLLKKNVEFLHGFLPAATLVGRKMGS